MLVGQKSGRIRLWELETHQKLSVSLSLGEHFLRFFVEYFFSVCSSRAVAETWLFIFFLGGGIMGWFSSSPPPAEKKWIIQTNFPFYALGLKDLTGQHFGFLLVKDQVVFCRIVRASAGGGQGGKGISQIRKTFKWKTYFSSKVLGLGREEDWLVKEQFSNVVIPDVSSFSFVLLVDSRTERRFFFLQISKDLFRFPDFLPSFPSSSVLHSWKLKIFALISLSEEHCLQYLFHTQIIWRTTFTLPHIFAPSLFFRPITAAFKKKDLFWVMGLGFERQWNERHLSSSHFSSFFLLRTHLSITPVCLWWTEEGFWICWCCGWVWNYRGERRGFERIRLHSRKLN